MSTKPRETNPAPAERDQDLVNVGIAKSAHPKLQRLKEDGHFNEMVDAYRFAVALALAHGGATSDFSERQNLFNIGTLDPDRSLHTAVATLRQQTSESVYKTVERLATWGVEELDRRSQRGMLSFAEILGEAEDLLSLEAH
jgi:hypothetical protein